MPIMQQNIAQASYSRSYMPPQSYTQASVVYKSFQNFLNNSAQIISNLVPNEDGTIECSVDASKYSHIIIVAVEENSVTQAYVDIDYSDLAISKRDLSLTSPLDPKKCYNEIRNTLVLKPHESSSKEGASSTKTIFLSNYASTDYLLVDSIAQVQQVQIEI